MNVLDLPRLRRAAYAGKIIYTNHAMQQMHDRGILKDDVELVLTSSTNQLVESQPPSTTPGKRHLEERSLIYDPNCLKEVIVICTPHFDKSEVIVITAMEADYTNTWDKTDGIPSIIRK